MSLWLRGWLLAACTAALGACLVYDESLLEDDDDGGDGGDGGREAGCDAPEHCPGEDGACSFRTCIDGACGFASAPAETPCAEMNGRVCDGEGSCVTCVTEAQCEPGEVCSAGDCVPPGSQPNGASCTAPAACESDQCVDGVCCANACTGACMACNVAGSAGACAPVSDGLDPDDECDGADSCNGSGDCQCGDGATNGTESDLDCGGGCTPCLFGQSCNDGSDCASMSCQAGSCGPVCGDTLTQGGEQCDDGNTEPYDGCSPLCLLPVSHLLISEVVVTPNEGEMVEIYNPTGATISLENVYLADYNAYWQVAAGTADASASDFHVQFPAGASIGPGSFVVVSLQSTSEFILEYGVAPDFDFDTTDAGAPAMIGDFTGSTGLTNTSEMLALFSWNGAANLVTDIDYLVWGSAVASFADKTLVTVNGSSYQPDTPVATQDAKSASAPASGSALHRCDTAESTETKTAGNGIGGHDETSEAFAAAWKTSPTRTPKAPAPAGLCP